MRDDLEQAFMVSEAGMGLSIVVHDLRHMLWNHLPHRRFRHAHAVCQQVKTGPHGHRCLRLECADCRQSAQDWPQGRVQRCHAGLSELVQPVMVSDELYAVLFAGPAVLCGDANEAVAGHDHLEAASPAWQESLREQVSRLAVADLPRLREQLRQLAARLRCWYQDQPLSVQKPGPRPRRQIIEAFITQHYGDPVSLADLAAVLGVSSERCRHVVREVMGITMSQLLRQARLQAACALLLNSQMAVSDIGQRCGYPDASGFSRHFRAAYGLSPGRWRARHRG